MRRFRRLSALATALLSCVLVVVGYAPGASSAPGAQSGHAGGWQLSTTRYSPTGENGYVPTYLGNGYFSARIPAEGTGFSDTSVTTESQLAGFYGQGPGTTIQRANLPAWSTLGFSDGSGTFGNALPKGCAEGALCEAESGTRSHTRPRRGSANRPNRSGMPSRKGWPPRSRFNSATNTHLEYDGYNGQPVNQADVVMLQYPWNYPMDKSVAQVRFVKWSGPGVVEFWPRCDATIIG